MIKKYYRKLLHLLQWFFNLIYIPYLLSSYRRQLNQLPEKVQIFLMVRMDFGTFLYLADYMRCWEEIRGPTCVAILTEEFQKARQVIEILTPQTLIIHPDRPLLRRAVKFFGRFKIYDRTLLPVYGQLLAEYPHALRLFDPTPRSCYVPYFDWRLKNLPNTVPEPFFQAYKKARLILNQCDETVVDSFQLHYQAGLARREVLPQSLHHLKKELGIKDRYVVMNLNIKTYKEKGAYRKQIHHPARYNCVIDYLIAKGYSVVIQGRHEQHAFESREGLVDYARSRHCSIEHDIALFSGAHFAILNKTGPESFCTLFNIPQLGLDFSELTCVVSNAKLRFYPKYIRNIRTNHFLSWKEMLFSPSHFDVANHIYDPDIEFCDLEEEDLLAAVEEFEPLASQPDDNWLKYTKEQKAFRNALTPLHLDLYDVKTVPCNAYLSK